jgi:phage shock protein C
MTQSHGLFRSRTDKVFGGVCGGIAKSLNTDPFLIRLIFAILFIFAGGGILIYVILWIALPEEPLPFYGEGTPFREEATTPTGENAGQPDPVPYQPRRMQGTLIAGLILIGLGLVFLADRFIPRINFGDFWPVVIVIAGIALIASSISYKKRV